ncbi:MFS general substrate transporter [Mollisia scopiformis]|uniref:MFS general substrate transporter n=1 Tax=Mollisia scopiformis TaxID=149040 RepID=A0A194X8Y6_MOLSC|nr:MFS general substrate transporter [Mollisia scopiformis]KUJ16635.1 MFS general substrate transporter [Mollisia scopiformis]
MADSKGATFEHLDNGRTQHEQLGEQIFGRERQYSLWKAIKVHKRIIFHCVAAFGAGMCFGYDTIANGATISMPGFVIYFGAVTAEGELYVPSIWASLWTAMSYLLQAMGGFLIGFVSDRVGRKWPCVGSCVLSIAGVGIQFGATSRAMLLGGKMVNGLAIGCLFATATAWASEISPLRLRGPIQSAIILFMFFMQAIGLVVVRMFVPNITTHSFKTVFAVQWAWPIATGLLFIFMPESPTWLLLQGRTKSARNSLEKLYGSNNEIEARLAHMALGIRLEEDQALRHGAGSYVDLFKGSSLKRTLTVVWMFLGFGFTGACLLAQSIYFLIIAGLEPIHSYDVAIGGFGIAIFAIVGSWFFMEKTGRRLIFLVGAGVNCVVMFVIGGLYYTHSKGALWAVAIIMNLLISWQAVTLVSTAWAITGEISSYRLRAKTQGVAVISNAFSTWLFTFTVAYIYNVDAGNLGIRAGFVYGGGSLLFFIFSFLLVPDLRGFSTEEIDWLYENKVPSWRIQENVVAAKEGILAMEANFQHEKVVV